MRIITIALGAFIVACSSSKSGGEGTVTGPAKACEDTADALASSAQRCGLDYQANYDAFVDGAAGGSCSNIIDIRDEGSLRAECIPFLRGLTCEQLGDPNLALPPSCSQQLLRQG